jgi:beta-glucanase (GH16 family)
MNPVTFAAVAAVVFWAVACLPSPEPAAAHPQKPGSALFFDDFSAPDLDRTKWTPEVWGHTVNDEQQSYVDSPDVVAIVRGEAAAGAEGGALAITAQYRAGFTAKTGRQFDFVSGRLITRGNFEFTYGTAAARMKLPAGAGLWPAFWALGTGKWPDTGEIDVMENVGDPAWVSVALHGPGYSGDTPLVSRFRFPAGQDASDWHVYSVAWTPDTIHFRVDDAVIYNVSRAMVEKHGRWAYDNPKYLILNLALGGNYPHSVNKADAPYRGLPAATVDAIKNGRARVFVDWVRVTGRGE